MADNQLLETVMETFAKDRTKENFVKVMEQLEKAVVYLPSLLPENLNEDAKAAMRAGKGISLPRDAKIAPCILKRESGEQVLPVFSSQKQVPKDKQFPALLALPFFTCVDMAMVNRNQVGSIVLNPFTQNVLIPQEILAVAKKRGKGMQTKTMKLTEKQFHELAHRRICYELLPVFLFEKKEEGLKQLQQEEGKFLRSLFVSVYPKEIQPPFQETDFSLMTLNVTDTMQIVRIDMPERNMEIGSCFRIYVVWQSNTQTLDYYTIEKADGQNAIGKVHADRRHEIVMAAPDNGAEIETVMNLASGHANS